MLDTMHVLPWAKLEALNKKNAFELKFKIFLSKLFPLIKSF